MNTFHALKYLYLDQNKFGRCLKKSYLSGRCYLPRSKLPTFTVMCSWKISARHVPAFSARHKSPHMTGVNECLFFVIVLKSWVRQIHKGFEQKGTQFNSCTRIHWVRIRIQHVRLNTYPMTKNRKIFIAEEKNLIFLWSKITTYLSLGLHKGRPSYRRNVHAQKRTSTVTFFYFCGSF